MKDNFAILKATPAYTPAAYNHHNFQSDNRIVSRTNKKGTLEKVSLFYWYQCEEKDFLGRDCEAIGKVRNRLRRTGTARRRRLTRRLKSVRGLER